MTSSELYSAFATLAAVAIYGAVHSLLASRRVKSWSKQLFGRWHDRFYRLFFNLVGTVTFVPVLAVAGLTPGTLLYRISPPWLWITAALQLASVAALFFALMQTDPLEFLGISQAMGETESSAQLVRTGLYRWVRHPLYTAGLVFIWSVPVMTSNILALNLGITLYLYIGSIFEERKLLDEFGETYQEYQQNVPRLIPLPWRHA